MVFGEGGERYGGRRTGILEDSEGMAKRVMEERDKIEDRIFQGAFRDGEVREVFTANGD